MGVAASLLPRGSIPPSPRSGSATSLTRLPRSSSGHVAARGQGTVLGTIIGALIMAVLLNGLRILSVAQEWQTVVTGSIIILAVYADMLRRQRAAAAT